MDEKEKQNKKNYNQVLRGGSIGQQVAGTTSHRVSYESLRQLIKGRGVRGSVFTGLALKPSHLDWEYKIKL